MTDPPNDPEPAPGVVPVPTEEEVAAELAAHEAGAEERRYPSTLGGVCYLVILAATAVGIGITWSGDWRLGVRWVAGALLVAAFLRLVLPARDAGMLAVRHRFIDCLLLGTLGGALAFLAQTIPNQPGL